MFSSSKLHALVRTVCLLLTGAFLLTLVSSRCYGQQEERWRIFTTTPENVRNVWSAQARHVASELELERQAAWGLVRAYVSARQEHLDRLNELRGDPEAIMKLNVASVSALEKSLVESLGEEKGKKASALLGGFSFLFDHMVADVLAAQNKAMAALFKYEETSVKVMNDVRKSRVWQELEKLKPAMMELIDQASSIYSDQQLGEWEEKYGWFFKRALSE